MSYFRLSDMECQHCYGKCEFWDITGPYCVKHWNERNERVRLEMEIKRENELRQKVLEELTAQAEELRMGY